MQLYEQVLQKCSQQSWFGTDSMLSLHQSLRENITYQSEIGCLDSHFYYIPASEVELQATEVELGFPLPHQLRSLYQHVANGGFGPDHGLIGVTGGCTISFLEGYPIIANWQEIEQMYEVRLADIYRIQTRNAELVDFEQFRTTISNQGAVELPYAVFPHHMCLFGYADGGMGYMIDATTGSIYRCEGATASTYRLIYLAFSLEAWLQPWLRGTWTSPFTERMSKPFIRGGSETKKQYQQRKAAIAQMRQTLYREPRQFSGPHAELLARIYQRCLDLGGLIFQPVTQEHLLTAEARLGRTLPSLLREVYLQVGNGGFGPTYGLHGIEGGYPYRDKTIVDSLLPEDGIVCGVNVSDYDLEIQQKGEFILESGGPLPQAEPRGCICLSDDGCAMESWLHLDTQRVFQSGCLCTMRMHYHIIAPTLEDWFESWLEEDIEQSRGIFGHMINHVLLARSR